MFPTHYDDALSEWMQIRESAKEGNLDDALHSIHNWCQQVPMVNHNLHIADYKDWPGPWDLLAENNYCEVAKSMLIVYTLLIANRPEIYSMTLLQSDNYTYVQLLADSGEYILNDQPGMIKADLNEVQILHTIDCNYFKANI